MIRHRVMIDVETTDDRGVQSRLSVVEDLPGSTPVRVLLLSLNKLFSIYGGDIRTSGIEANELITTLDKLMRSTKE